MNLNETRMIVMHLFEGESRCSRGLWTGNWMESSVALHLQLR